MAGMDGEGVDIGAAPAYRARSAPGLWILLLIVVVLVATAGASVARIRGLEHGVLVALIGLAIGLLMGSRHVRFLDRAVIGLAVGAVGTISAVIISVLIFVLLDPMPDEVIGLPLRERDLQPEIFVASIAGVLGVVTAGTCAFGAIVGGVLRGWLAKRGAAV